MTSLSALAYRPLSSLVFFRAIFTKKFPLRGILAVMVQFHWLIFEVAGNTMHRRLFCRQDKVKKLIDNETPRDAPR
jgi:hypothetical protein